MNRREFMMAATAAALGGAKAADPSASLSSLQRPTLDAQRPPRNRHPYQGIDWATAHQIRGTTHVHCTNQADLDEILKRIEFLTLSNYYPSAPWYPLAKMTENYWREDDGELLARPP